MPGAFAHTQSLVVKEVRIKFRHWCCSACECCCPTCSVCMAFLALFFLPASKVFENVPTLMLESEAAHLTLEAHLERTGVPPFPADCVNMKSMTFPLYEGKRTPTPMTKGDEVVHWMTSSVPEVWQGMMVTPYLTAILDKLQANPSFTPLPKTFAVSPDDDNGKKNWLNSCKALETKLLLPSRTVTAPSQVAHQRRSRV